MRVSGFSTYRHMTSGDAADTQDVDDPRPLVEVFGLTSQQALLPQEDSLEDRSSPIRKNQINDSGQEPFQPVERRSQMIGRA